MLSQLVCFAIIRTEFTFQGFFHHDMVACESSVLQPLSPENRQGNVHAKLMLCALLRQYQTFDCLNFNLTRYIALWCHNIDLAFKHNAKIDRSSG